jgi:hypothetical protein
LFYGKNEFNKNFHGLEKGIITIQRKYRNLKSEINSLNYSVSFQRDYLMSMINTYDLSGKIDFIIDDGSHISEHIITSFKTLYPHIKKGGYYPPFFLSQPK